MKLKATFFDGLKHLDIVTSLAWKTNDEVFSSGDDHCLIKWNTILNEAEVVSKLPDDFFSTSLHWYPKNSSTAKKVGSDSLLAASADGKCHFLNKNGRFDKSIDAHQGAVLVALWSYDGAGLLTGGEDGQVKVWSRSGMLRSTVVSGDVPVYTAAWGPDSNQVLVAQGRSIFLKPLAPNTKPTRWRAHEGIILKVSWNQSNNLIVSAAEDCRYKVWDAMGHCMYTSSIHDHPVTSVSWSPTGDLFAVASFNTIRLCDRVGWSHSLEKVNTGSIYDLGWSPDGTQLAGACGNGAVIFAHVIDRRVEWKHLEVTLNTKETVSVRSVCDGTEESLEFSERVSKMAIGFDHLVVTTSSQCHIFSTTNWNTPIIIQLKDGSASHISLTYKYFYLIERNNLNIYGYDGKLQWSPKLPGIQMDILDDSKVSLSSDTLAVIDQNDTKNLHLIDLAGNRQASPLTIITHSQGITMIALSQTGTPTERMVAYLDQNCDAYVAIVRSRDGRRSGKLGSMAACLVWGEDVTLLAAVRDSILTIWCCPQALYIDNHLLRSTTFTKDLSAFGKGISLVSLIGNMATLRRSDGSLVNQSVPPYIGGLLKTTENGKWEDSLRLCRFVQDNLLWACLACHSSIAKELTVAEEALAAINELDKVAYIHYIKSLPLQAARKAYLALLSGNATEAENILLMNGLIFRAIMLLIDINNWNRAMDLAVKHRTHVDTVLYRRKLYLDSYKKTETNEKFVQYQNEELDFDGIKEKIAIAYSSEIKDN